MNNKFILIFACVLILLGLQSCKSKKTIVVQGAILDKKASLIALNNHNTPFEWFAAKGKMNFKSNVESGKADVRIRIKRDSVIWMQIKRLGIEFGRVLITQDSIFMVYRFDKAFERGTLSEYTASYGLDLSFDKMQNFFVGNCLLPDGTPEIESEENVYHLYGHTADFELDYWINNKTGLIEEHTLTDKDQRSVNILFDNYKPLESGKLFPYHREYFAPIDKQNEAYAKIKFSAVEFDVEKKISFEIPAHYTEY